MLNCIKYKVLKHVMPLKEIFPLQSKFRMENRQWQWLLHRTILSPGIRHTRNQPFTIRADKVE
jgi:hypothetical protein